MPTSADWQVLRSRAVRRAVDCRSQNNVDTVETTREHSLFDELRDNPESKSYYRDDSYNLGGCSFRYVAAPK